MSEQGDGRFQRLVLPPMEKLFPFEYQGGGYFRRRGVPNGEPAEMLHGEQAMRYLYDEVQKQITREQVKMED